MLERNDFGHFMRDLDSDGNLLQTMNPRWLNVKNAVHARRPREPRPGSDGLEGVD